jgi:prepilin signal peptidase PulO-like enzyme (type II secretory pathway)
MIIVVFGLLGVIFGSFANACVWRLHELSVIPATETNSGQAPAGIQKNKKQKTKNQKQLTADDLSILKGRSMCPNCHHELAAKDLVPLGSWLSLRGKCRYCHAPISAQYPLVELATGLLFAVSYAAWPLALHGVGQFTFVAWLLFIVFFVILAVYDLRWFLLPDKLVWPLVGLALAQVGVVAVWVHTFSALWQPLAAAAIIFSLFWVLFQVSDGNWIGGGDVKLVLALGLLAGTPLRAFLVIFLASLLGTLVSIPLLARGKAGLKLHIPFGPYLLAATILVVLYGTHITNWYQNLIV